MISSARTMLLIVLLFTCGCASVPVWQQDSTGKPITIREEKITHYIIQPGDLLEIKIFNVPELNDTVRVYPDGSVSFRLIGNFNAAGMTLTEFEKTLNDRLKVKVVNPEITVFLRECANMRAFVGGEVDKPQLILLTSKTDLLQAILAVGGPKVTAKLDSVILIRRGIDNIVKGEVINLAAYINGIPGAESRYLLPNDVIVVPKTGIAEVNLLVDQYINKLIPNQVSFPFMYNLNPDVIR
ncbi:MAG TPA: polysaccharide export protein [Desulfuromonadales bacterium]|nr:polysaccharide export protein [Desulfuromonadales bacterium]